MNTIWLLLFISVFFLCLMHIRLNSEGFADYNKLVYRSNPLCFKKEQLLLFFLVLFFSLLTATRLEFFDTRAYINLFEKIRGYSFADCIHDYDFEPGFCLLTKLISLFTSNYKIYFFIFPIINYFIISKALKLLELNPLTGMLVYFSTIGLYYNLIVLRQGVTISLLFLGYAFFEKKKNGPALICAVIAFLFHKSALFVVLVLLISRLVKVNKNWIMAIAITSLGIYFIMGASKILPLIIEYALTILPDAFYRYSYYIISNEVSSGVSLLYVAVYLFNILFLAIHWKDNEKIDKMRIIVIGYFVFAICSSLPVAVRIVHFFDLFYIYVFTGKKSNKMYFVIFTVLHVLFYLRFILVETVLFI